MNNLYNIFSIGLNTGNAKAILLLSSFLGGVIASISPCSLAMLPIVIGYIGGYANQPVSKTLVQLISFILGSAIVFTTIGIICAVTGHVFISIAGSYFMLVVAAILMIMGLNLTGLLDIQLPSIINKIPQSKGNSTFLYPMLLGATFALGGTPCSTPILAGIMSLASASSNMTLAVLMLFLFSIGQGIILVLAGVFTSAVKQFGKVVEFSEILLKISGILLILASAYFYYKIFSPFLH